MLEFADDENGEENCHFKEVDSLREITSLMNINRDDLVEEKDSAIFNSSLMSDIAKKDEFSMKRDATRVEIVLPVSAKIR